MSDNTNKSEQQQQMKEIFICDDIWLGVFAFLCIFELGQKMALISDRLNSFVNAFEPVNFIIITWNTDNYFMPFELKNNWTGERLTFRRINEVQLVLVRCPIGREEDKWANWEKEAIGMLEENDKGPSEPKKPRK
ncbi:hypothetical protein GPALN_003205 [Globodera pallida]|nr:hypothetical protein GPALN_003205 [Globodera pallida]